MLARLRGTDHLTRRWVGAGAALVVLLLPLLVAGPGNDLDVANIFRSGRSIARHGSYLPSRAPGSPVHETVVGVLDLIGGPLLTNLFSLAGAVAVIVGLDVLLAREGLGVNRRWALAVLTLNPWFLIAATSTTDYLPALAFVVGAALAVRSGRPVWAGLAAALAMGCRVGSATLLVALVVAEVVVLAGPRPPEVEPTSRADRFRPLLTFAVVALIGTAIAYLPSYLQAHGLSFAQNDFSTSSPFVQLGRAVIKDVTLLGTLGSLALLAAVPSVIGALRRWSASWLVRFAVTGLGLSQLLFLRFPWKVAHLLPSLVCLVVLLAVALEHRPRLLVTFVVLQIAFAVVSVNVVQPNDPDQATGARLRPGIAWGPVVQDWRCRRDHPDAYRGRQKVEVEAAWRCAKPFD